jgi:hypothetical protein
MSNFSLAAMSLGISTWNGFRVSWVGNSAPWVEGYGSPIKRKKASQPPGMMRPRNSVWEEVIW